MNGMARYTIRAGSQGALCIQRAAARLAGEDVRRRLSRRLNGFHCDLRAAYTPRRSPATARAGGDGIVPVGLRGLNLRGAVKAPMEATGPSPHPSVCGRPFRLDGLDDTGVCDR